MEDDLHLTENRLLGLLLETKLARLKTHLVRVEMTPGSIVYEASEHLDHVYFSTTSMVSIRQTIPNGESAEIAVVDNDGLVGTELFMGDETTTNAAVVQNQGEAYRLSAQILKEEFCRAGVM
jgi:CRP-like cAMP-binding protein